MFFAVLARMILTFETTQLPNYLILGEINTMKLVIMIYERSYKGLIGDRRKHLIRSF